MLTQYTVFQHWIVSCGQNCVVLVQSKNAVYVCTWSHHWISSTVYCSGTRNSRNIWSIQPTLTLRSKPTGRRSSTIEPYPAYVSSNQIPGYLLFVKTFPEYVLFRAWDKRVEARQTLLRSRSPPCQDEGHLARKEAHLHLQSNLVNQVLAREVARVTLSFAKSAMATSKTWNSWGITCSGSTR